MDASRRAVMRVGLGAGVATLAAGSASADSTSGANAGAGRQPPTSPTAPNQMGWVALDRATTRDQSQTLQHIIDHHASIGAPIILPPGRYHVSNIQLRSGAKLIGASSLTEFVFTDGDFFFNGDHASDISVVGVKFNGNQRALASGRTHALLSFQNCRNVEILDCTVRASQVNGVTFEKCSGRVQNTLIEDCRLTGLFSRDSRGFDIVHNDVRRCGDNGIQVWRSAPGHDASRVCQNRVTNIAAKSGGSGQYGNGINIFRADGVSVTDNHISNCAFSAVRANSASNLQIIANTCSDLGEVAVYSEFAFEGAMIANNLIANAATGISVANFNEGGRLATVTSNLIRNLMRRESEPVDKRGVGIFVEADSVVANNIIENAPTAGLHLGWGRYRRDLLATQNIIRNSKIGIMISADAATGATLVSGNLISGSQDGAIRRARMDQPIGPDLVTQSGSFSDLTLSGNIAPASQI